MPIYEFQCQSCGTEVEVLQKISEAPLKDCDACGKPDMKKMVSAAAFRLSGSGWYETDFKKGKKKNLTAQNDNKSESKENSKPKPKSDVTANKDTPSKNKTK